jgi:integrase
MLQLLTLARSLVVDAIATSSRRIYAAAVDEFITWALEGNRPLTKATVQNYRAALEARGLAAATINVRLSAVRRLAAEAADNGMLDPQIAAGVERAKGAKSSGVRTGNWLSRDHAERLLSAPRVDTLKGQRDAALLAVMVGCGLRREETACLTFEHMQQREARWVIVDLVGKGKRVRTVPMPFWAKAAVDQWAFNAGIDSGRVFRPVNKGGRVGGAGMTSQAVFKIVVEYGRALGFKSVAPHDLRRTFAKLAHKGNAPLEQIQFSLGHASIQTTERYLGMKQDLHDAPCDRLGLKPSSGRIYDTRTAASH